MAPAPTADAAIPTQDAFALPRSHWGPCRAGVCVLRCRSSQWVPRYLPSMYLSRPRWQHNGEQRTLLMSRCARRPGRLPPEKPSCAIPAGGAPRGAFAATASLNHFVRDTGAMACLPKLCAALTIQSCRRGRIRTLAYGGKPIGPLVVAASTRNRFCSSRRHRQRFLRRPSSRHCARLRQQRSLATGIALAQPRCYPSGSTLSQLAKYDNAQAQ